MCLGGLTERKNVLRLADALKTLGRGTLTFAGDGPLRAELERRGDVTVLGLVPAERLLEVFAAADVVCQPSLVEPFGQALLEAMACGRPVLATSVGGPPEFVPADGGVLVDPADVQAIAAGMRAMAQLPRPNAAARTAAERHDVRLQAERIEAVLERAAGTARS